MTKLAWIVAAGVVGALATGACSTSTRTDADPCTPGDVIECTLPNCERGEKVCGDDGLRFGACECVRMGSGGSPGTGGGSASGGSGGASGSGGGGTGGGSGSAGSGATGGSAGSAGATGGAAGSAGATGGAAGGGGSGGSGGVAGQAGGGGSGGGSVACSLSPDATTIGALRAMPNGPVTARLCGVYVTTVTSSSFYVQRAQQGPAINVFLGSTPMVSRGNLVDLEVTSLADFNGLRQVGNGSVLANDGGSFDVLTNIARNFQVTGEVPSESNESELVRLLMAEVIEQTDAASQWVISYGTVTAPLFAPNDPGLCIGARVDLLGVSNDFFGRQIAVFSAGDFSNLNTSACP